ncbi:MAG TPA: glycerate kinase [Parvibaculum sp.]|jgi:hydroxypyruvate reductase
MTESFPETRALLKTLYGAAVRAALPGAILGRHLPSPPKGRLVIFAIGKAAAAMAAAAEAHYVDAALEGLALTRYGHGRPTRSIEVVEAGHPVPDANGVAASARILDMAKSLGPDDFALVLISGGGSALAALPIDGVSLDDKRGLTRALLASGTPIADINCIRKHLSRIKGGRLAQAIAPAPSLTLAISDVAGDDPAVIASGPTVPDPTTRADARAALRKFHIEANANIIAALESAPESPKPGDPIFAKARYELIASGAASLKAAAEIATAHGYEVIDLGDRVEGEARDVATRHARLALEARRDGRRVAILSGGELAVTFMEKTAGRGGPNQEYALALALALQGAPGIAALAGDTDGIDGGSGAADDPAGALVLPDTLARAHTLALDPLSHLAAHDSGSFFAPLGDLLQTGPSYTNVNDFRVILIERP